MRDVGLELPLNSSFNWSWLLILQPNAFHQLLPALIRLNNFSLGCLYTEHIFFPFLFFFFVLLLFSLSFSSFFF